MFQSGMARRKRSRIPRPVLGVAFALVLLGTIEAGLRAAGVREAYRSEELGQWRFAAGLQQKSFRGPRDGHSFVVSSNADGLRTTLKRERTAGMQRIAVMGDSTVFGWGVNDGEAVADGIQAVLDPRQFEVLNAGQPGYSTTMASWLFDLVVAEYKPDLTIVFIPLHDTNRVLVSDAEVLDGGYSVFSSVRVWLASEARMYQVMRSFVFEATDRAYLLPNERTDEPRVPRVSDAERTRVLEAMIARAGTFGGKIAVGYLPFLADIDLQGSRERETEPWVREFTAKHGISFVDVRTCCPGSVEMVLSDDPGHLSAAGNLRAGAGVAQQLVTTLARTSP